MFGYPLLHTTETASTYSRLHVLLGILDSCVKWEKSAENAVSNKCSVSIITHNRNCLHLLKATCSTGYTGFLCEVGKVSRKCRKSMFRYPLLHTIETVSTYSRLHVLLGILDSCVKWEKSAENAVSQCSDIHYYTPQKLPLPTPDYMFY